MLYSSVKTISEVTVGAMKNSWYPPTRQPYNSNFVVDPLPSTSREQRNKAEKQRRDRLNSYIGELATLVPMVAKSSKRLDKTSILRLTATHLRIKQMLNSSKIIPNMNFPRHIDQIILEQLIFEQMGGFLLIVLTTGKIVFVSNTVENLLGHVQTDLMGQSLFNITAPEDHDRLKMYLQCEGDIEQDWRKCFNIRLKRAGPRSESAVYEQVRMMGMHRQGTVNGASQTNVPSGSNCGNSNSSSSSSTSSIASGTGTTDDILVFFSKVCRPEPFIERLIEASKEEYVTRHLIDGRIIGCDQRISIIAGYMTEEVMSHSAFMYMHREDVRWVMIALRQMYDRGEMRGSSCYRLQSRNGQFIFLRTNGFLEIDDQGTVESFICVNTLVSEMEGLQLIDDMKKRYSAICSLEVKNLTPPPSNDTIDLVEDPSQVEQAVAHLMANLPSPGSEDSQANTPSPSTENQDCTMLIPTTDCSALTQKYHMKRPKRPLSTDATKEMHGSKKHKLISTQELMSTSSYTITTVTAEVKKQDAETPIYQQNDQLISHNL